MAEVIHTRRNMITKTRYTKGEGEERIVDILVCPESLTDQQQHSVGTKESSKSLGTGPLARNCDSYRVSDLASDVTYVPLPSENERHLSYFFYIGMSLDFGTM